MTYYDLKNIVRVYSKIYRQSPVKSPDIKTIRYSVFIFTEFAADGL